MCTVLHTATGVEILVVQGYRVSQIYPSSPSFCAKFMQSHKSLYKKRTKNIIKIQDDTLILTITMKESYPATSQPLGYVRVVCLLTSDFLEEQWWERDVEEEGDFEDGG